MATDTWLSGNGNWSDGTQWSLGAPPASTDTAIIDAGAVNTGITAITVAGLAQGGGTISGNAALTVTGAAVFSGPATQTGTGETLLKGTSQINTYYLEIEGGRVLENAGTLTLAGGYVYLGPSGGTLINNAGASFLIESDGTAMTAGSGSTGITNAGLVEKEFSVGTSIINAVFADQSTGTVSVQSGTIAFEDGGSSSAAAFTVAAGATLEFDGGTFTLTGGSYGKVAGQTLVAGGTLTLDAGLTMGNLTQSGGTVSGDHILTVTGPALFSGPAIQTGTGETLLKGTSQINTYYLEIEGGRVLENAGTLTLAGGYVYLGPSGGTLINNAGASFLVESDGTAMTAGSGSTGITNAGLVEKEFSVGTSIINAVFADQSTGTVSVQSGTIAFEDGGSSSAAAFTVAAGATLEFDGGTFTLTGGSYGKVAGQTLVAGGTLTLDAGLTMGNLTQSGGTVSGDHILTVTGPALFSGPAIQTGTGETLLKGTSQINTYYLEIEGGRVLENAGTLTLAGGYVYLGPSGGTLINNAGASFLVESDGTAMTAGSGSTGITNAGLVEKEFSVGTSIINAVFADQSTGTVSVQSGTIAFEDGGSSSAAAFTVAAGATLEFDGGIFTLTGGSYGKVAGQTLVAGGTLTLDAGLTMGNLTQSGGAISGGHILTVTGPALFSGPAIQTGTGETLLKGTSRINTYYLEIEGGRVLENAGTLTLAGGAVYLSPSGGGGTLVNNAGASFLIESDGTAVTAGSGSTGITNAGLVEKEFSVGTSIINAVFADQSTGTVSVQSGTIAFEDGGSSSAAAFTVAAGATLEFDGGTFTLTGGSYSAAGETLVAGGTLLVNSTIASGTTMTIGGGMLEIARNSPTTVNFSANSGELILDHSQTFAGKIAGLTPSAPSNIVDLKDVNFAGTSKSYSSVSPTSGTLTISDGTHTAHLTMIGNYTVNSFNLRNDGSGHVEFYDPATTHPAIASSASGVGAEPSLQSLWVSATANPLLATAHHS